MLQKISTSLSFILILGVDSAFNNYSVKFSIFFSQAFFRQADFLKKRKKMQFLNDLFFSITFFQTLSQTDKETSIHFLQPNIKEA